VTLAAVVKDICEGVAEGFRRGFFEGLVALGKAPLKILEAAAQTSLALLLLAGTVVIELFGGHRGLTAAERAEAEKVFGTSIDLARVKIAVASLPADVINYLNGKRPFTSMYIINFGSGEVIDAGTLIHELTHVWQGVNTGALYMSRALQAQLAARLDALQHGGGDSAAYQVTSAMLAANGGDFGKFNPEQQATIVEWYYLQKFAGQAAGSRPGVAELEPYARQVFRSLRPVRPLPIGPIAPIGPIRPIRPIGPLGPMRAAPGRSGRAAPAARKTAAKSAADGRAPAARKTAAAKQAAAKAAPKAPAKTAAKTPRRAG
jgi:hypothetical protein